MIDLDIIGRTKSLFENDLNDQIKFINKKIKFSSFLIVGAAGTIGQSVTSEIFSLNPKKLHVVDISENNLVELVRFLRSSEGYNDTDFRTYVLDSASDDFKAMVKVNGPYDFILNLSALKHVRSEKDPYTLSRLIEVNIFNSVDLCKLANINNAEKYFCVSTDKAANPVNMMGASKRIMELFLIRESENQKISFARFANVAFSDGSLLHGFNQRFLNKQPLSAPNDVKRYFVTRKESGQLCLMSCLFGENRDIFFPKLIEELHETNFADIARRFLAFKGFEPYECYSEEEAREKTSELIQKGKWPCYFFKSDTTGEKNLEEFYTQDEDIDISLFEDIGVVKNKLLYNNTKLKNFENSFRNWQVSKKRNKKDLVSIFRDCLPEFSHSEKGKFLDQRM